MAGTTYTLRWSISQAPCATSTDDVIITLRANPTAAGAGPDQSICGTSTTLAGNSPAIGVGTWSIVSGSGGGIVTPGSPNSTTFGATGTTYTLRWTITNAPCAASSDDVLITYVGNPTVANAGSDQTICGTTATLAGNTPGVGSGSWSIIAGVGGTVTTPGSPTSAFTGVQGTTYTLRWTISNPPCTATTDDVLITLVSNGSAANAGADQTICGTSTTLAGNVPGSGSGLWTIISGVGGTVVTPSSATSTFNCVAGNVYTLRWTVTNSPCAMTTDDVVITTDIVAPTITCPASMSVVNNATLCSAVVSYTDPVGTDNCPSPTTTRIAGLAGGSTFPVGTTTNTFRVTDASGTTATCSFTITVTDGELPSITCPANMTVNADPGVCTGTATYSTPVGTDNCPSPATVLTAGFASGGSFPSGTTTNTYRVTDAAGNFSTCSFTVVVVDNQVPTITCPANMSVANTATLCTGVASYAAPTGADNCTATTSQTLGLASGATYPVGPTTNTFQVTDAAGNSASCSFIVTVTDAEAPAISCPPSFSLNTDLGQCTAVLPYPVPAGTDNCAGATTSQTAGLPTGFAFPIGPTTCAFLVTDAAGNTSTCAFTATVVDNEAPQLTCPLNFSVNTGTNTCDATTTFPSPSGADNCAGGSLVQTAGIASGGTFPLGATTNSFLATDGAGNTATCSFVLTVTDNVLPAINCPAPITLNAAPGFCTGVVTFTAPVGTDNCVGATTAQIQGFTSGSSFPVGITSNKFQVTDAAGNTSSCTMTVTVVDVEAPAIVCPSNMAMNTDPGGCTSSPTFAAPVGTDNCTGATTAQIAGLVSGSALAVGVNTNTFRVTDAGGNTTDCSFTITVTDNQAPSITCPANISVNTDVGQCGATVTYSTPNGTDNCSATTTQTAGNASGATFTTGVTTNTFSATDASANATSCSFTVTVTDNQSPTWSACPANMSVSTSNTTCDAVVSWTAPTASDNCAVLSQSGSPASGSTFALGTTTVTYTAADAGGNTGTCAFTVTVSDNVAPIAACHNAVVILDSLGNGSLTAAGVDNGSTDNCGPVTLALSQGTFTCINAGTSTITLIVTDSHGNTSTCNASINVVAPAVSGTATAAVANCGFNVSCNGGSDGVATAAGSGGCPSYSYLWSNGSTNATASGLPAGIVTVTITDGAGGTHVATVTLTEPTAMTSTSVPSSSCLGDSTGAIDLTVAGGNDCLPYTFLWSNGATTEDLSNLSAGTYTVTITDGAGCTRVETATVTAFAALNPTITNAGNVLTSGQAWTSYQWLLNGSNINGATTNTYTATTTGSYSLFVTDANGCTAVTDTVNLTIVGIADQAGDWMSLTIFPNPARNEFRLRTDAPIGYALTVHIYDMYGKQYGHQVLPDLGREVAFDIKSFSAGTYFVEVTSDAGQRKLFRLVVQ